MKNTFFIILFILFIALVVTIIHKQLQTKNISTAPQPQEQTAWGIAANPSAMILTRTITISMTDDMRFTPNEINIEEGETVQFLLKNEGKVMHEFVMGTPESIQAHAEMMKQMPNMHHHLAYMAHVAPGEQGNITWIFNRTGKFNFACLMPGHYEAGMRGIINVSKSN